MQTGRLRKQSAVQEAANPNATTVPDSGTELLNTQNNTLRDEVNMAIEAEVTPYNDRVTRLTTRVSRRSRIIQMGTQSQSVSVYNDSARTSRTGRLRRQSAAQEAANCNAMAKPDSGTELLNTQNSSLRYIQTFQKLWFITALSDVDELNMRIDSEVTTHNVRVTRRTTRVSRRSEVIGMGSQSQPVRTTMARQTQSQHPIRNIEIPAATIGLRLPIGPAKLVLPHYCSTCNAKKFAYETLHFCCGNGEVQIAVNEYPLELKRLFTSDDEDALHFKKYARLYNNLFAFSSLGGNYDSDTHKGIYVFKGHGQMYHFVPDLLPTDGKAKYLQLYFYDGQHENTVLDQRVYNAPSVDEVAGIWPDNSGSSHSSSPHIVVQGECGWTQGLKKTTWGGRQQSANQVDPIMSCAVHTEDELLAEEKSRRCLQQYIVDMYVKIENTRLDFFRKNQDTIRADLYQGVLDSLDCGETVVANVGRRVILPPTYIGGPRDMKKRYYNAMDLVHKFGKPDLFVTMTCNANWPEIKNELGPNEQAQDRPDLVARIFHAKLISLKKEIKENKCFGEVAAMIFVVEFQKRGLPHAHFLVILKPECKLKSIEDYDRFVSAEIPPTTAPVLRKIVLQHMMHGPCGNLNPKCSCMRRSRNTESCKSGYPKQLFDDTIVNKEGYPLYRRKNTGEHVKIRGAQLDNRWVIPYNPYLSVLFDSHINVEVCSTIRAVKYLYKYVYKGHDRIQYNIVPEKENVVDEIKQYQSGRWVSSCEDVWRIFGFDLFEMYPPVLPLPVHLPNMQSILLRPHERLQSVVSDGMRRRTPLT
ncbi:uncharacterized protein LOC110715861 [Chenopodium quinoa]|uniref:uncharacterized protein LOC110715861 n=1 Tax=Chenopodium quinoa TaxID=63459 RepID=UPI000B7928CD|nr:uncharacterized protein LOC110715861 [Chenopodium quinoa]